MSAIEQCRSAALGGHVLACQNCEHTDIAYNSCRNRHCPKCQASAARRWLEERQSELLPVAYYHVVFTLPAPISEIAYYNKAVIYGLLFDIAAETLRTIAADPKHLGAKIGATLVLHTWGSALTHHPHEHGIVPGGGLSEDGERWVACKTGFLSTCTGVVAAVPAPLYRRARSRTPSRLATVLRRPRAAYRCNRFYAVPGTTSTMRIGGLRQAPVCRA